MCHADTMDVTLGNGSLIHQISVEDDYSRGYMALCVFPKKHTYFVILTLLRAFRLHRKPKLFHHDNGGEYNNGVVSRLLRMLDVVDVPTEVENPKGIKGAVGTVWKNRLIRLENGVRCSWHLNAHDFTNFEFVNHWLDIRLDMA